MYMLESDQEPSSNLMKNLLLLLRILKMIVDMVDDSTPLISVGNTSQNPSITVFPFSYLGCFKRLTTNSNNSHVEQFSLNMCIMFKIISSA